MRIIHLSDIHLNKEKLDDLRQYYLTSLIKDLKKENEVKKIDLIAITGDLIDQGGLSFKGEDFYKIFDEQFITPIANATSVPKTRFFFTPGNHDVIDTEIDQIYENGLLASLTSIEATNNFIKRWRNKNYTALNRIDIYKKFEAIYYTEYPEKKLSNFESCFITEIEKKKIGIITFNSIWRFSRKLAKESLVLGTQQILDANDYITLNNCDFVIALFHYPLDKYAEFERKEIQNFLQNLNFDLILIGHNHSVEIEQNSRNDGNIFISIARTAFSDPRQKITQFKPGYSIIDINLDTLAGNCFFRRYVHDRLEFDKDIDAARNGELEINIANPESKKELQLIININNRTASTLIEEFDNSLITSGTDSMSPHSLKELFVLPKISDSPVYYNNLSDSKTFVLSEIINFDKNILLLGMKEIGKTTLLERIFIEISENYTKYKKIPIFLDYKALINKKVTSFIARFINESPTKVIELLKSNKVILLIDNLDEAESVKDAKPYIKSFLEEYPDIKIIATSSSNLDIFYLVENPIISADRFLPLFIQQVSIKEFKELSIKWFKKSSVEWLHNNLEKLVKVFEILRIPRTFFSMSLYLWLIEKQENFKPVNRSNLIEKFLTYILEGLKIENAKAGTYTYDTKIELLMEIAFNMFKEGDKNDNYSLSENKIKEFVGNIFELNQRTWNVDEKVNEFINKGVLKRDSSRNVIRFRYECFFQYFLSLNLSKKEDFKKEVFSEINYLSFIEELDFYTAKKQDDQKVLEFVIDKLKEEFKDLDEIIENELDKYLPNQSFLLRNINTQSFIPELRKNKLKNEEIEEVFARKLESLPIDDKIKIKQTSTNKINLGLTLELASRILKNSENIKNPKLINDSLDLIIEKTVKYGILLQFIFVNRFLDKDESEFPFPPEVFLPFIPVINQLLLLTWMGTDFLEIPIRKKIDKLLTTKSKSSEYELFITSTLYSDLKLSDYLEKLKLSINFVNNKLIIEMYFIKILIYYMFRNEEHYELAKFERFLIKLLVKGKGISREKAKAFIEKKLRSRRKDITEDFDLNI